METRKYQAYTTESTMEALGLLESRGNNASALEARAGDNNRASNNAYAQLN